MCSSGDCTSCPPRHVVRQNVCVDDDVTVELSMPGALASWSDAGVTLWHAGPLNAATVHAAAVSARASLNDAGTSSLDFPVSLVSGHAAMTLGVRAPSGRTAEYALNVLVTRGISETPCFLTATNELDCSGERLDAGTFVGVGGPCGLNTAGEVWCRRDAGWQPAFPGVAAVVDVSPPCVRTLDGRAVCETDAGLVTRATDVRNLECRAATCCALNASGEATCWGRNEYRLFAGTGPNFNPFHEEPVPVPNLPGQYARLTSGGKTFFAMTEGGIWTAATNGMGFPTAPPFVLTDATADTLKLESPYYCIVGLEADGGTWWVDYTYPSPPPQRLATDAGPVIDVAPKPGTYSTFRMLTTERGYVEFDCHR